MKADKLSDLGIIHYPNPSLREKARPVEEFGDELQGLADRMIELMVEAEGVGLAATQLGVPQRIVILRDPSADDGARAYANPEIISSSGKLFQEEGCLSVPGVRARVRRAAKVTVRACTLEGEQVEIEAEGLMAVCWQQEINHLDGILFIDKVGPVAKIIMRHRLKELEERYRQEAGR